MIMPAKRVLLTGATGFVGSAVLKKLPANMTNVFGRRKPDITDISFYGGNLNKNTVFVDALVGVEVVIHVAARAHIMVDAAADPLTVFREINTAGTLNFAKQAAAAGAKRFIFISSIKVNGESTAPNKCYRFDDKLDPQDPYSISKAEAEIGLLEIAKDSGMKVVIIRPPLVYGPGVKANFATMMKLAQKNYPLPLGAINNKRSLVALDNLVDLIITCIDHPKAENQTFLVSDDNDVSTTELLQMITRAVGKKSRLIPLPMRWIKLAAILLGKKAIADRLCGSLQIDLAHTKVTLGWKPPISLREGIERCFSSPVSD
jgi:UDP-glucose 4-epimerase